MNFWYIEALFIEERMSLIVWILKAVVSFLEEEAISLSELNCFAFSTHFHVICRHFNGLMSLFQAHFAW